jgi:hypothetical protein
MPAQSRPRPSVLGRRPTASSTWLPRSRGRRRRRPRRRRCLRAVARQREALGAELEAHALGLEDVADAVGHVLVLARQQARERSTTVTAAPKRRIICANSSPM